MNQALDVPVVLFIFRRPDTTQKVVESILRARPRRVYVFADAPRDNRPDDVEPCAAARAIIDNADWPGELIKDYADTNRGLRRSVVAGLNHVFLLEQSAIILEDDCVAHETFYQFASDLLSHYADDQRIMAISGSNFQQGRQRTDHSYYFSHFNHCWGWATWARAWKQYDDEMSNWPQLRKGRWLRDIHASRRKPARYWQRMFNHAFTGKVDSWAYRWLLSAWQQNGLAILPNVNLVSNIGFQGDGTNTFGSNKSLSALSVQPAKLPIKHPPFIIRDVRADEFTQQTIFKRASLLKRIKYRLGRR